MANMKLIEAKTISSTVSSVVFSSIPQTYTDLKFIISAKSNFAGAEWSEVDITFNGGSTYNGIRLQGNGSTANAYTSTVLPIWINSSSSLSTNYFSNTDIYISNYATSGKKYAIASRTGDANSATALMGIDAFMSNASTVINTVTFSSINGDIIAGSTFYLYGISNTITSGAKAYGGYVTEDTNYWYHTFLSSGTFTPTQSLSCEYLLIAGGGGGGGIVGAGGGAGGVALGTYNLSATSYAVTIGAGGSAGSSATGGSNGGNSVFHNATVNGGGGGGSHVGGPTGMVGNAGGSGGGGAPANVSPTWAGGASNQGAISGATIYGNAGGESSDGASPVYRGGGGGGAGAVGATGGTSGNGGNGVAFSSYATATFTGVNNYYAGGGGGSYYNGYPSGTGGLGGGGDGISTDGNGLSGVQNTGSGGGASSVSGGSGGSGLLIVRYAK